jgi:5-dehydro-2-deoxygluconokinase
MMLFEACRATGHELMLELIAPAEAEPDPVDLAGALESIYALGLRPDWWKLPAPGPSGWARITEIVGHHDPRCRGVLLLGQSAPEAELFEVLGAAAREPLCKGFAVGRSIFGGPAEDWFAGRTDDAEAVAALAAAYRRTIDRWRASRADL